MKKKMTAILILFTVFILLIAFTIIETSVEIYPARYAYSIFTLKKAFDEIKTQAASNDNKIPHFENINEILAKSTNNPEDYEINISLCNKDISTCDGKWLIREKNFPHTLRGRDTFHARRAVLLCNGDVTYERAFSIRFPERYKILLREWFPDWCF